MTSPPKARPIVKAPLVWRLALNATYFTLFPLARLVFRLTSRWRRETFAPPPSAGSWVTRPAGGWGQFESRT